MHAIYTLLYVINSFLLPHWQMFNNVQWGLGEDISLIMYSEGFGEDRCLIMYSRGLVKTDNVQWGFDEDKCLIMYSEGLVKTDNVQWGLVKTDV